MRKAETPGSYTVPAHVSFFSSHLPKVIDESGEDYYTKDGAPLWKLKNIGRDAERVGVLLDGYDIFDGYRNKGYTIRGFGGTGFFLDKKFILRRFFADDEFIFFPDRHYKGRPKDIVPRSPDILPLNHIEDIVDSITHSEKWFLFINDTATHLPYHLNTIGQEVQNLIRYANRYRNGRLDKAQTYTFQNAGKLLLGLQIEALEYADRKIGDLLTKFPKKNLMVVICGDHGESFGETRYWGHMNNTPEVLHVPLLISPNFDVKTFGY